MNNINNNKKAFTEVLNPYWTEYLWDIISKIKDQNNKETNSEIKKITLSFLKFMLENDVIYVGNKFSEENKKLIKWEFPTFEILDRINKIWFIDAKYPDYYSMVWFSFNKWYVDSLEKKGVSMYTSWLNFTKEEIGDLEKWILENKPKN